MELCQPYFRHMEEIRDFNQLKMLKAFTDTQMSSTDMLGTTGYGLWDTGRAKLEQIFAEVMGAEDALVRSQFQSGTHTLAVALFGLLRAGDTLLAATGRPYDTLEGVIGLDGKGKGTGTLMDYGIKHDEAPLKADLPRTYELIAQKAPGAKVCPYPAQPRLPAAQRLRPRHHPQGGRHRPRRQPRHHHLCGQLLRRVYPNP